MNPKLASLQVIFSFDKPVRDIIEKDELSVLFRKKLTNLELKSTILEVPKEIPDIPFLILQSADNRHRINISNSRLDYVYTSATFKTLEEEKEILQGNVKNLFNLLEDNGLKVIGVGNITTFVLDDDNPINKIKEKFIVANKQSSFDQLLIQYNRKEIVDAIRLNVITTITSGEYKANQKLNKAIIVQKNINSDGTYSFTKELFSELITTSDSFSTSAIILSLFE